MKPMISEILDYASKIKSRNEKIQHLRKYDSLPLRRVLHAVFSDVKFLLPNEDPPYKRQDFTMGHEKLYYESKKLAYFLEGGMEIKQSRREEMFIQFLESIHPADAEMMMKVRKKRLPYPTITENLIRETFPDLLQPKEQVVKENEPHQEV